MKKVVFVLVSLLLVSYCWALESDPSNEVGYIKLTCNAGGYTTFGLPFVFWDVPQDNVPNYGTESRKPSDIIGSQATAGNSITSDKVVKQGGETGYRKSSDGLWTGALETSGGDPGLMEPGRAYWYQNKTAAALNIVLAGQVDKDAGASIPGDYAIPVVTVGPSAYVTYSWRDSRVVPIADLGLLTSGFTGGNSITSDKLIEQGGATGYYKTSDGTWQTLLQVTPGKAYWIQNKHTGTWSYDYNTVIGQDIIENPNTPEIQKVSSTAKSSVLKAKGARE
ncbi:MAG: hypothetical protein PHI18_02595 [bacterium]|nr:hypothetical protein [bacterium]